MDTKIIRLPEVMAKTGFRKTKIYKLINSGEIKPFKLGIRAIGFLESEVEEWIKSKVEASRPQHINNKNGGKNA